MFHRNKSVFIKDPEKVNVCVFGESLKLAQRFCRSRRTSPTQGACVDGPKGYLTKPLPEILLSTSNQL